MLILNALNTEYGCVNMKFAWLSSEWWHINCWSNKLWAFIQQRLNQRSLRLIHMHVICSKLHLNILRGYYTYPWVVKSDQSSERLSTCPWYSEYFVSNIGWVINYFSYRNTNPLEVDLNSWKIPRNISIWKEFLRVWTDLYHRWFCFRKTTA